MAPKYFVKCINLRLDEMLSMSERTEFTLLLALGLIGFAAMLWNWFA